jgi:ubiquinol-cytochrome c reductase core subunit 2
MAVEEATRLIISCLAHEFHEEIENIVHLKQAKLTNNALGQALDNAHSVAFHKGLGSSIYPSTSTTLGPYLNENSIAAFAETVYTKPNIVIVADGASQSSLSKWIEPFFRDVPASASSPLQLFTEASKYYGGEQRTSLTGSNAMVLAFPGHNLNSDKADVAVLTALLGGQSSIKWSPGFSLLSKASAAAPGSSIVAKNLAYTDAGLLTIQITGSSGAVRKGAGEAVKALKSVAESGVSKEVLTKAIAKAKFDLLSQNELTGTGIVSTGNSLIHGGKIFQVTEALKGYEAVTTEKVKAVSVESRPVHKVQDTNTLLFRRRKRCWTARRRWQQRETCTCSHTQRRLASRYRILVRYMHQLRDGKMYQQSKAVVDVPRGSVNIALF